MTKCCVVTTACNKIEIADKIIDSLLEISDSNGNFFNLSTCCCVKVNVLNAITSILL